MPGSGWGGHRAGYGGSATDGRAAGGGSGLAWLPGYPRSAPSSKDLVNFRCIGWPSPTAAPYKWEFSEGDVPFSVAVNPQITTNDLRLMLEQRSRAGITFAPEATFRPYIDAGQLEPLLGDFLPPSRDFSSTSPAPEHASQATGAGGPY